MRTLILGAALLAAAAPAAAGPLDDLYLGGAVQLQRVDGTGTWGPYGFDAALPLPTEDATSFGFAWTDRILLGLKPTLGWAANDRFALQVDYGLNIPKQSSQTYVEADLYTYYEQGIVVEWAQRNLELVGLWRPDPEGRTYLFAGWDLTRIAADITLYEGAEWGDVTGDTATAFESDQVDDTITAHGLIVGAGLAFRSEDERREVTVALQYSTARTGDDFFATEDFDVAVGGFTLMIGLRWYPFRPGG